MEQMFDLLPCYLYTEDTYLLDRNRYIPQKSAEVDCTRFDLQLFQVVCFEWVPQFRGCQDALVTMTADRHWSLSRLLINGGYQWHQGSHVRLLLSFCMKRFRNLSMEGVGLALRSVTARVKDATAKRSSVSAEVRIKFKMHLLLRSLEP